MHLHVPLSCDGDMLDLQEECIAQYIWGTTEKHTAKVCALCETLFDKKSRYVLFDFNPVKDNINK